MYISVRNQWRFLQNYWLPNRQLHSDIVRLIPEHNKISTGLSCPVAIQPLTFRYSDELRRSK